MSSVQYTYTKHIIEEQNEAEAAFLSEYAAGHFTFDAPFVKHNPYLIAPLTALVMFQLPKAQAVHVRVAGKTPEADMCFTFPATEAHCIPVYGLYADWLNTVELTLEDGSSSIVRIQTAPLPDNLPLPEYVRTTFDYMGQDLMFASPSSFAKLAGFDAAGDVRWYATLNLVFDVKRVSNGNIWVATERLLELPYVVTGVYEMSTLGKIYHEYRFPGGTHHDYSEGPNNTLLALSMDPDRPTVEDECIVVDRETGDIIRTFDFTKSLPASAAGGNRRSDRDWLHTNACWYDEKTNSLSISGRNLDCIANFDFETGELNWILGDPEKWPQEYIDKYFFTPVVEEGEAFDWFYAQHACQIIDGTDVLLFDNGAWRSKYVEKDIAPIDKFSRGVRYHLDFENRTVRQVWQYGKERGWDFFSPHISNAVYYGPGHYMIHSGDTGQIAGVPCDKPPLFFAAKNTPNFHYYATTVEVQDGDVKFEMRIPNSAFYRAKRFPLYDERESFHFGAATQLGALGKTHVNRMKAPKTLQPLPDTFKPKVHEEIDRFSLNITLQVGDYANLILRGEDGDVAYLIPTAEKDELQMCVGSFQLEDLNETVVTISKGGLAGSYHLFVAVEGVLYDLDLDMTI